MLLGGGLGFVLLAVTGLLLVFATGIVNPLREITSYVEKISLGELRIEIPDTTRKDEIGKLTEAMQRLVFSLQLVAKKLRDAKALKTKMIKSGALKKAS
jgi:methyl-accepting chemotaxis protein